MKCILDEAVIGFEFAASLLTMVIFSCRFAQYSHKHLRKLLLPISLTRLDVNMKKDELLMLM